MHNGITSGCHFFSFHQKMLQEEVPVLFTVVKVVRRQNRREDRNAGFQLHLYQSRNDSVSDKLMAIDTAFRRPISPYRRSSSLLSSAGLEPRMVSNKAPADPRISFFYCSTSCGCTLYAYAISLTVFTPRIASSLTFDLNSAVCDLLFLLSLICCHPFQDNSLNYPVVTVSNRGFTILI